MKQRVSSRGFSVDLHGQVAVVLGASAQGGTGWAIAESLAMQGAKVVVAARSLEPLQRLASRINGEAIRCDAASPSDIAALADAIQSRHGRLDIAVNAAALPMPKSIPELTTEDLLASMQVNYCAHVQFTQHMARVMEQDGSIVLITSMAATHPLMPHTAYACAKAASDCFVRYAALEYGPRNIRINSIQPGAIKSDMTRAAFANPDYEPTLAHEVPLGRIGLPNDYANAVLWLAGPAFVTGLNLNISGGNQLTRFPYLHEFSTGESTFQAVSALADRAREHAASHKDY